MFRTLIGFTIQIGYKLVLLFMALVMIQLLTPITVFALDAEDVIIAPDSMPVDAIPSNTNDSTLRAAAVINQVCVENETYTGGTEVPEDLVEAIGEGCVSSVEAPVADPSPQMTVEQEVEEKVATETYPVDVDEYN